VVGEFADHSVPRSVRHLLSVLAVSYEAYVVADVQVLAADLLGQVDAVTFKPGVAVQSRLLEYVEVRRRLRTRTAASQRQQFTSRSRLWPCFRVQ